MMRLSKFLVIFLFSTFILSAGDTGGWLGVHGEQSSRVGLDLAIPIFKAGYATNGVFVSAITGKTDQSTIYPTSNFKKTTGVTGFQVGYFADLGRGYFTLGGETLQTKYQMVVNGQVSTEQTENKSGGYIKAGYRVNRFGVFIGYGSATGAQAGVSVHF